MLGGCARSRTARHVAGRTTAALVASAVCLQLLTSCTRPRPTEPQLAGSAAASNSAAFDRVPPARRAAVAQCVRARRDALAALAAPQGSVPIEGRAVKLGAACAAMYSEPRCSDVFRNLANLHPSERAAAIARACHDAYCPRLVEPKPALCAPSDLPVPSVLAAMWRELDRRIASYELGLSLEQVQLLFGTPPPMPEPAGSDAVATVVPLDRAGATQASTPAVLSLTLGLDERGRAYVRVDGGPKLAVSVVHAAISDRIAVLRDADADVSSVRALIHADRRVTHGDVIALIDALRAAGITRIAFSVDVADASAP